MRVADRDHELADAQALGVAERRGRQIAGRAHDREIGERVGADQLELDLAAVGERRVPAPAGARDDVRRGEQEAVARDHDAAAAAVRDASAAQPT